MSEATQKKDTDANTQPKDKFWDWRKCTWFQSLVGIGIASGILLMFFGFLAIFLAGPMVNAIIDSKLSYIGGSPDIDDKFSKKPSFPIKHKFHFFDILNKDEFLNGEKPRFDELGPYVYDAYSETVSATYSKDGTVVERTGRTFYYFNQAESKGSESDKIKVLNIPMLTALDQKRMDPAGLEQVNGLILSYHSNETQTPFLERTVREAIWGVYHPLMAIVTSGSHGQNKNDKFGFYSGLNDTVGEPSKIATGKDNMDKINRVLSYNGSDSLPFYTGDCSIMRGVDGSRFHPKVVKGERLYLFVPNFCRVLPLDYKEKTEVSGIPTFRYAPPDNVFGLPDENPENICYCTDDVECSRVSGLFSVGKCNSDAPIFMSWPHFFQADQRLLDEVDGISPPSQEEHQLTFDVQPRVGFPLRVHARTQINVRMRKYEDKIESARGLQDIIFPVFWISVGVDGIDQATADLVKMAVNAPDMARNIMAPVLMLLGAIVLGVALFFLWKRRKAFNKDDKGKDSDNKDDTGKDSEVKPVIE